ncbi:MAG: hypothetical protein HYV36_08810 [Lentisphaerae bacterium]|nr:hypothetical protein [Lentisphaerota bacterium]
MRTSPSGKKRGLCLRGIARYFFSPAFFIVWLLLTAVNAQGATYYVSPAGNDANNGTSWTLAKQTIQAGINAATSGDTVLVADGTYLLTNQISISPGITVRSVNGAQSTTIDGGGVTRCAYLDQNAVLDGFTLTNGDDPNCGGGVLVYGGTVANCMISGNSAYRAGGGVTVEGGTVMNCTISGNAANEFGGGVFINHQGGTVVNCTISGNWASYWDGGGVFVNQGGTVMNCTISGNIANINGGGVYIYQGGMVMNCTISGNSAYQGGGVFVGEGTLPNYTISGNSANWGGGVFDLRGTVVVENCTISGNLAFGSGGGVHNNDGGTVRNCIMYYNQSDDVYNNNNAISYSCIGTNIGGTGNITNEPQFVAIGTGYGANHVPGDYRLRPTSPCINAGINQSWMTSATDLDGLPRIVGGIVDMGAYEFSTEPGTVQFSASSYSVNENAGTLTLTVTRAGGRSGAATVEYATAGGTASAVLDYTSQSGTLSWPDADISSKTITVSITDDSLDENDETFTVTLSNATGADLGSPSSAIVTIVDNDDPPVVADLEVSDFKFVPVNLWAGDHPAMIEFVLVNGGPADIDTQGTQLEITFYLSVNQTFGDADDIAIGTKIEVLTLPAGDQTTIRYPGRAHNEDVTIPEGLTGDYYVFVNVRLASSSGLSDPDGAYAMRDGPINVRIHPADGGEDTEYRNVVNDYDGDGLSDMMSYDEPSGKWTVRLSASGELVRFIFGGPGYETVSGDYDGDGLTDPAIHDRQGSAWSIMLSELDYQTLSFNFGGAGETKGVVGDYDKDGLADPGLYEEGSGRWYVLLSYAEDGNGGIASAVFGGLGFAPVAGDYDGDGKVDPAVYAEATGDWQVLLSAQGYGVVSAAFGGPGNTPVVGDYDGDGKSDPMLFNQATGEWTGLMSANSYTLKQFQYGAPGGQPLSGDFDGDGQADPAVLDSSGAGYFWLSSSSYLRAGPYSLTSP